MKSREISKKLKVSIDLVYRTVEFSKRRAKNLHRSQDLEDAKELNSKKDSDVAKVVEVRRRRGKEGRQQEGVEGMDFDCLLVSLIDARCNKSKKAKSAAG